INSRSVGVGIAIANDPLHRSGRADLPHPALTLGDDAKTAERIGMTDSWWWQPALNQAPHPVPSDTALLAASRKHAVPSPAHLSPEGAQRRAIHGHPVVAGMPTNTRAKPLAHFGDGIMHAPPKLDIHFAQLRL